jgi:hypothetical protein
MINRLFLTLLLIWQFPNISTAQLSQSTIDSLLVAITKNSFPYQCNNVYLGGHHYQPLSTSQGHQMWSTQPVDSVIYWYADHGQESKKTKYTIIGQDSVMIYSPNFPVKHIESVVYPKPKRAFIPVAYQVDTLRYQIRKTEGLQITYWYPKSDKLDKTLLFDTLGRMIHVKYEAEEYQCMWLSNGQLASHELIRKKDSTIVSNEQKVYDYDGRGAIRGFRYGPEAQYEIKIDFIVRTDEQQRTVIEQYMESNSEPRFQSFAYTFDKYGNWIIYDSARTASAYYRTIYYRP